jgi:hypothetical protein
MPSGLSREFHLGTGCAENIQAYAERISLSAMLRIPVVAEARRSSLNLGRLLQAWLFHWHR